MNASKVFSPCNMLINLIFNPGVWIGVCEFRLKLRRQSHVSSSARQALLR